MAIVFAREVEPQRVVAGDLAKNIHTEYHGVRRACSRDHSRLSVLRVRPLCLGFATVPRVACAAPLIGEPDVGNQFWPVRVVR